MSLLRKVVIKNDPMRISGPGFFMSKALLKNVPLSEIMEAIHLHEQTSEREHRLDPSKNEFHTLHKSKQEIIFRVASNHFESLISAYLADESSGF